MRTLGVLIFPEFELLDVFGPLEMFGMLPETFAIRLVAEMQTASTSMLQRRLRLGYTRAGRLIDMLERRGVISGYEGSKPRQVLVGPADAERFIAALKGSGDAPRSEPVPVPDDE